MEETILVVDDDVLARMVISDYLRGCGYKVLEAANADEAIAILRHAPVDVLLSVVEMPGLGFTLSQWVRRNRPETDVILTASVSHAANAAAELCDSGPLPRPYDPQIVVDRIRRLRANRSRGATG